MGDIDYSCAVAINSISWSRKLNGQFFKPIYSNLSNAHICETTVGGNIISGRSLASAVSSPYIWQVNPFIDIQNNSEITIQFCSAF